MSKLLKRFIFCTLGFLLLFAVTGLGDVGNFNSYSGGSSSGGGSWSSSSSSHHSAFGSSSSSSDSNGEVDPLSFIVVIFILLFMLALKSKIGVNNNSSLSQGTDPGVYTPNWPNLPNNTEKITQAIKEYDPAFNTNTFMEWAKEVFINLQYAWMDRDWEKVRHFESDELYSQHEMQLQEYKRLGRINVLERINIYDAYFFSLVRDKEYETLSVVMQVRMIDYIIDEQSRAVLKGDPNRDCYLNYFYIFRRKVGVKTLTDKDGVTKISCPNCGAPTRVVSSGRCEYCDFVIKLKDYGWVLSDIVGIRPPYNYGTGGVINNNKTED